MKLVVTRTLPGGVSLLEAEERITDLWIAPPGTGPSRSELLQRVRGAHGVICMFCERIDAEFLDEAGPQLRVVANYAAGYENLDFDQATRRGVWVTNTPDTVTPSTADMTWALLLATSRRIWEGNLDVRRGNFAQRDGFDPCFMLGGDLEGRTLLIVGAGRIGLAVAQRSTGWRMNLLYTARTPHPEFEAPPINARRVDLQAGLAAADYVSIHTPLTRETRHLIGRPELARMKPSAIIVNTARGPIIDEAALVEALRSKRIAGAGLDVYEDEPQQSSGLRDLPNTCLMPHVGSASLRQRPLMSEMAQRNVLAALVGQRPPNALNELSS